MVDLRRKAWESRAPLARLCRPSYRRVSLGNQLLRRGPTAREPFPAKQSGLQGLGDPRPVSLLPGLAAGWIPSSQFTQTELLFAVWCWVVLEGAPGWEQLSAALARVLPGGGRCQVRPGPPQGLATQVRGRLPSPLAGLSFIRGLSWALSHYLEAAALAPS